MEEKTIIDLNQTNFIKGIALQREKFKFAKSINNVEQMLDAVNSIKIEIKTKAKQKGLLEEVSFIEKRIDWIKGLRSRYTVKTRHGIRFRPPRNYIQVSIKHLEDSYEKIIDILTELRLL